MVPHDAWVFYSRHNLTYTTINGERYGEHWVFSHQLGKLGKRFTISRQNRRHELGNVMPRSSNISHLQDFRAAYCCGQEDAFFFCSTGLWYAQKSWDHSHTRKKSTVISIHIRLYISKYLKSVKECRNHGLLTARSSTTRLEFPLTAAKSTNQNQHSHTTTFHDTRISDSSRNLISFPLSPSLRTQQYRAIYRAQLILQ